MHLSNLSQMAEDIVRMAKLVKAPHNIEKIQSILNVFDREFSRCPVEFRTNTKPLEKRGVSFRYVDFQPEQNPFELAINSEVLQLRDRSVDRLFPEILDNFPVLGYGVDAGANTGLEKIWPFLAKFYPIEEAFSIKSLPESVKANKLFFKKHRLSHFSIVAVDFFHETTNLYFPLLNPSFYTADRIRQMIEDLEFPVPDQQVLDYNAQAVFANLTFSWDSPIIERLCFYVPAPMKELVPISEHQILNDVVESVPILSKERAFIIGYTFTPNKEYIKIEVDYTGTIMGTLRACTMLDEVKPDAFELR